MITIHALRSGVTSLGYHNLNTIAEFVKQKLHNNLTLSTAGGLLANFVKMMHARMMTAPSMQTAA